MEMSYEAYKTTENKKEQQKIFAKMVLEEIKKMQGAELAPHLACIFDADKLEYRIILTFPISFTDIDTFRSNIKCH